MLAQSDVARYLLQGGLISAASIVDGDLKIVEASRRNRNFKVISDPGPSYLMKQGVGSKQSATIEHESRVYQFLESAPDNASFRPHLPRYYTYDANHGVLVLQLLTDVEDFREYHARLGHFPVTIAAALGRALGRLHRLPNVMSATRTVPGCAARIPWVLALHRPGLGLFREVSHANLQLIRIIQHAPEFTRMLDQLRNGWRIDSLVHNDIKWDNCLVPRQAGSRDKHSLKIVDWEFAALGDSCWDAGAVFSNYLSFWLFSIPVSGEEPPDRFLELARYPLERMQPAIRAYWQAYLRETGLTGADARASLVRAVKYAGARLVQTGFEQMQHSTYVTGNLVCLLQLSVNIMQRPHEAIAHLLGISV